ncbi:MAG: redox-regulated ATPase YchF [Candidatus Magasanikbacteria bacterium RIFCSPHIGHO2_02_FULL_51_14]|uniref:Ribosome-binding ATPase YchF n=1 Tax=Candidatus Magasanikbacteria bacterium RIFCSPHIGHO2_02_FULL_51_14 TaxID=1798683 RepID=A0A1F6MHI5_9BACT|nr:MAG: redox-regulated ATPase YchF [Candidatus Magasanikbacteria bacterium RIFCSPHIGHO2_02_FULL_51_14]
MLSLGIVGLPNVGKSTLFNALTRSKQANVQNYPFCTIEPNVGVVEVPDERLAKLAAVSKSKKIIPTAIEFVDIAGLVKGAAEGEGLGNKFLSHIREVDAIVQVVRAFEDPNITHVHNKVDPKEDADVINLELVLADWEAVAKRLESAKGKAKGVVPKDLALELALLERLSVHLESGKPARLLEYSDEEQPILKELHLLTMKPMMYVVNVNDQGLVINDYSDSLKELLINHYSLITVSARLEAELAELSAEDAKAYMVEVGLTESGLDKIIKAGYALLHLITYFTSGEPETRAWTVTRGTRGPDAAGVIHTDFVKGFIKADVVNWQDFVTFGGWSGIKGTGKLRLEGKEYVVQDGDVCYFHVSV